MTNQSAKAVFVFDTNLPTIYGETVGLTKTNELLHGLMAQRRVLLTTSGWYEQAQRIAELLNIVDLDIIAGDGCVLKMIGDPSFYRTGFIKRNDGNVIVHLAVLSGSGLYIKGVDAKQENDSNVVTNYFLNHRTAHRFHEQWRFNLHPNTDYATLVSDLERMRVSEIYVLANYPGFNSRFLDAQHNMSPLVANLDACGRQIWRNTWLFTAQPPAKDTTFLRFAKTINLPAHDYIYISLGEYTPNLARDAYTCALPDNLQAPVNVPNALRFSVRQPQKVLNQLLQLADAADAAALARRTRSWPTA